MFLQRLIGLVFVSGLALSPVTAEVLIRVAPPHLQVEHRGQRPSPNHVWINGYHRWDGNAYRWDGGRWEQRPRPHAVWVAHRYEHRRGGWVYVQGHWR